MANLHLFFDGVTIPSGWTLVSDSGSPFYQRLVRGYSVYGGTGGSATHIHTAPKIFCGQQSNSCLLSWTDNPVFATCTHTHGNGTTASANNIPASKSLKVIKCNSGIPTTIPTGAIAVFDASVPSGWTRYSAYDDKFIYCDHTVNVSHGADTHVHSYITSGNSGGVEIAWWLPELGNRDCSNATHNHRLAVPTDSKSNSPPYLTVLLGRCSSSGNIPIGMIGMFDSTPSDWEVLSESGDAFYEKFILPHSSYGTTGGAITHAHGNVSGTSNSDTSLNRGDSGIDVCVPLRSHTHSMQFSVQEKSVTPSYINVIFAKHIPVDKGAADSCLSSEMATALRELTVTDVCTLGKDETVTITGHIPIADVAVGTVTDLSVLRRCTITDSCYISLENVYYEDCHPAWDSGVGSDALVQGLAELTVLDSAFHTEYVDAQLGLGETVGRMMWRFSTAYDKTSSSNLTALTMVLASEITKLEFTDILGMSNHFVDYAYGTSLNYIGALFSLSRNADETDTNYRARIKTAPLIAGGAKSSLKTAISTVLGIDEDLISIVDDYKGADGNYGHITVEFDISDGTIKYDEATFITIVNRSKAAGIKVDDVKTVDKYFLTFSDEGDGCHRANFTETDSLNWVCNK